MTSSRPAVKVREVHTPLASVGQTTLGGAMKFLMLVCRDESIPFTPEDRQRSVPRFRVGCRRWRTVGCVFRETYSLRSPRLGPFRYEGARRV